MLIKCIVTFKMQICFVMLMMYFSSNRTMADGESAIVEPVCRRFMSMLTCGVESQSTTGWTRYRQHGLVYRCVLWWLIGGQVYRFWLGSMAWCTGVYCDDLLVARCTSVYCDDSLVAWCTGVYCDDSLEAWCTHLCVLWWLIGGLVYRCVLWWLIGGQVYRFWLVYYYYYYF